MRRMVFLLTLVLAACAPADVAPTMTPTPSPTKTATPSPTASPTFTPSPSPTATQALPEAIPALEVKEYLIEQGCSSMPSRKELFEKAMAIRDSLPFDIEAPESYELTGYSVGSCRVLPLPIADQELMAVVFWIDDNGDVRWFVTSLTYAPPWWPWYRP